MQQNAKSKSFSAAMRDTFGLPGETLGSFSTQLKALTPDDRNYYSRIMTDAGIQHDLPAAGSAAAAA